MKFSLSVLFYLVAGLMIAVGIIAAMKGSLWLLGAASLAYLILFAKAGCLGGH